MGHTWFHKMYCNPGYKWKLHDLSNLWKSNQFNGVNLKTKLLDHEIVEIYYSQTPTFIKIFAFFTDKSESPHDLPYIFDILYKRQALKLWNRDN